MYTYTHVNKQTNKQTNKLFKTEPLQTLLQIEKIHQIKNKIKIFPKKQKTKTKNKKTKQNETNRTRARIWIFFLF